MDKYDIIIIGAGLSGLVSAYTLSNFGIKCCVLEKSESIGGGNKSFKNDFGDIFDSGYHALDESRSKITSSLFKKVMPEYYTHELNRAIILDGNIIKYNSEVNSWPTDLVDKLEIQKIDDVTDPITEDKLSSVYGHDFVSFLKEFVFKSYPSEVRAQKEGRNKSMMFDLLYPWFFPRLKKLSKGESESTKYHNMMRSQNQNIIYPKKSGFFGFIEGLYESIDKKRCDFFIGCKDLKLIIDDEFQCQGVSLNSREISADHYFWCAPFFGLAALYNIDLPKGVPQKLVLGSFRFDFDLECNFHEILVGDINHKINRISFPGLLRNDKNNLIQVEFMFPDGEFSSDPIFWNSTWLKSLFELGIIPSKDCQDFNFKIDFKGMVTSDSLDKISLEYESKIKNVGGNIFVPFVNAGPENINRLVPTVINNTVDFISKKGI